jgi:chemotaxis protein MotB
LANDSIIIKKKKVVGHAAHHGGSWKVAYADFVTAMMAFFMVLWIMGLSDDSKASIQGYFNDPAGFMKNTPHTKVLIPLPGQLRSLQQQAKSKGPGIGEYKSSDPNGVNDSSFVQHEVADKLRKIKVKDHVVVSESSEGIVIEFLEDLTSVFFESGSANISPLGRRVIKQVVPVIKDTGRFIVLEGHTDRKPYAGSLYTNWELSTDRASAFRKELALSGIPVNRFAGIRGYADTKLKFPKKPFAAGNRRVALLLPWGKKAGRANQTKIANEQTRREIGPKGGKDANFLTSETRPEKL